LSYPLGLNCQPHHFLSLAWWGGWPDLSLAVLPYHRQHAANKPVVAELARGTGGTETSNQILPWQEFYLHTICLQVQYADYGCQFKKKRPGYP